MHVLIVGAGIGGLVLAQSLRKQGVSYEIFDRDVDKKARFQGWAISIHTIIDQLISILPSDMPDLEESTNHLAPLTLPAQLVWYHGYREGKFGIQDSSPQFRMIRSERSKLRDWLLTKIPVQWNKKVIRVEQDDAAAQVFFDDGSVAKGDLVIGADGATSQVRESLLQTPNSNSLNTVPLSAIVGEVTLSGDAFKRQLSLGHSAYNLINPELGFIAFVGLHHTLEDGASGRFYWMFMQPDGDITKPGHWLRTASQQEKLDYILKAVAPLAPELREIFKLTPTEGVKQDLHVWQDLELESLPAGRIILVGDSAHAMTPSGGVGAFHTMIDAIKLTNTLVSLDKEGKNLGMAAIRSAVAEYNGEMLKRGSAAVRTSRASYEEAKRKAETKEYFIAGLRPLLVVKPEEIILEVKKV